MMEFMNQAGSFGKLTETPIDYLFTLNFMHGRTETEWAETYRAAAVHNEVRHFIVDTVPDKVFGLATHSLDWDKILPDNYKRIERFRVSWKNIDSMKLDTKRIREERPELYTDLRERLHIELYLFKNSMLRKAKMDIYEAS